WEPDNWNINKVQTVAKVLKNDGTGYKDLEYVDYMAANQGFFIKVLDASNSITLPLASRTHTSEPFQKSSSNSIKLKAILDDDRYISINIGLNEQSTPGFDAAFDGYHMSFTGIADMYSYHDGDRLSTNYIPYPEEMLSLPVYFIPYQNKNYVMKVENIELLSEEYEITLEDKQASQVIDLRDMGSYAFSTTPNDEPDRFILHLKSAAGIMDRPDHNQVSMYVANRELSVLIKDPVEGTVTVCNMLGQVIFQDQLERKGINRYKLDVSQGAYMVRIIAPGIHHSGKVFVK
ncbi:MAG: T9SS type A sorting domain-containing protein, partial [Bacteroidota bacterium]|nr:T9SS type A sorting domain-containing protein [Bacteroidota bacterium]